VVKVFCSRCGFAVAGKAQQCAKGGKCNPTIKKKVRDYIVRILVRS